MALIDMALDGIPPPLLLWVSLFGVDPGVGVGVCICREPDAEILTTEPGADFVILVAIPSARLVSRRLLDYTYYDRTFNIVRDNNTPEQLDLKGAREYTYLLLANSTLIKNTTNFYNTTEIQLKKYSNLDNIKRLPLTRIEKSSDTIESGVEEKELEKEKATKKEKTTKEEEEEEKGTKEEKATKEEEKEEKATKEKEIKFKGDRDSFSNKVRIFYDAYLRAEILPEEYI
ncbi:uncharacterized protein RAG0_15399 [Rhynchosporium agropyri]|uniref:Uncharacterized protein n=1 Tax=Rhynchosporium agropyri TaxID=914238 RepID=A0A1E1LKZ8_9HELO|nr:uncharacterized protein RAG0_15399 [Rhynchosporium agropyri]